MAGRKTITLAPTSGTQLPKVGDPPTQRALDVLDRAVRDLHGRISTGATGATGPVGPAGPPGATGATGTAGARFDKVLTHHFVGGALADFNDVNFGALGMNTLIYYDRDGDTQRLRGIAGGVDGITVCLLDVGGIHTLSAFNQDLASVAANRIVAMTGAASVPMPVLGAYWLIYDGGSTRWRQLSFT